jgi:hypothetical protein
MDKAYVFRRGTEAKPENWDEAELVSVYEYTEEYGDQIRCPYEPCFQDLTPIRPTNAIHHWRHPRARIEDYCPFRVEESDSGDSRWKPDWAALDDVLRKVRDKLEERGTECKIVRAGGERVGFIGSWGAIVPINPNNVQIRAKDPELEGRTVIPIVALETLEHLNGYNLAPFLRQIVNRQPVPVIRPKMEGPAGPWSLLTDGSQLKPEQVEDMIVGAIPISINPQDLFGEPAADDRFPWPPPGLVAVWVWTNYKDGLDSVKNILDYTLPLRTKVLRLLVKRLLVEGGSVHRALFAQSREDARNFFLIAEMTFPRADHLILPAELADVGRDTELVSILTGNSLVHECFKDLETQSQFEPEKQRVLKAAQAKYEEELMAAQASHEEELMATQAKHEEELMATQTWYEKELMDASANYEKTIRQHQQERDEDRSRIKDLELQVDRLDKEMKRESKEHRTTEENLSQELDQELKRTRLWKWLALAVALILILTLVATYVMLS